MRRSISKLPYGLPTAPSSIAVYSTSSGGGGRGRGGGAPIPKFQFPAPSDTSKNPNPNPNPDTPPRPQGHGRGRGSVLPSFASFLNNDSAASSGRAPIGEPSDLPPPKPNLKMPFFAFANGEQPQLNPAESEEASLSQQNSLPGNIFSILSTTGRGKPVKSPPPQPRSETQPIRATEQKQKQPTKLDSPKPQLSQEEKVRKAVEVLSRGGGAGPGDYRGVRAEGGGGGAGGGGGRGGGRGGRGGRGSGRGGYGGRGTQVARFNEEQDDGPTGMFFGDPADEEKVAKKFGPELMAKLAEGFEEMSDRVLPNPREEALLEAYETNLRFECDPEWFMENFATNPDIDEKPQIPLRVALEKMKPFLMAYEGIDSHEEWEEIMEETMEKVPLMKEIIDHYGGSDRATAKQQQEELKHVAETLPASAPASVKRFADRAVLSLQSNPGWGYDRKCQFMDKLIMEVSQQYK